MIKNNQMCTSDRQFFMVTGNAWFSQPLSATTRADIARQHRGGSINYILIEKEISSTVMLLHQLILFRRRNAAR